MHINGPSSITVTGISIYIIMVITEIYYSLLFVYFSRTLSINLGVIAIFQICVLNIMLRATIVFSFESKVQ